MTEKELLKQLNSLKAIEPDKDFARTTRLLVLSSKDSVSQRRFSVAQSFSFAASIGLVAVFLFVLTLGGVGGALKTLFLPSLPVVDNESLLTEADNVTQDIDIKLREIKYFESDSAVALAGNEAEQPDESPNFINNETEIDQLLDEVIDY